MTGDSTSYGAGTKTVTATLTMDDETTWSVAPFSNDVSVIDCYPTFDWLDTANATEVSIMSSESTSVAISSSSIPSDCPSIEEWILEFPNGNPYPSVLTEPVSSG